MRLNVIRRSQVVLGDKRGQGLVYQFNQDARELTAASIRWIALLIRSTKDET